MEIIQAGIVYPVDWKRLCELENVICNPTCENASDTYQLEKVIAHELSQALACLTATDIGLALSGGLDSSILAQMLKTSGASFTALTIADSSDHPDALHSRLVAKQINLNHIVHILDKNDKSSDKYDLLFQIAQKHGLTGMICGDTIDEQLGGYYYHQHPEHFDHDPIHSADQKLRVVYNDYWRRLYTDHLQPLHEFSVKHNIQTALPYLGLLSFTCQLPMRQRSDSKRGKKILRELGLRLGLPNEVLTRKKLGLCNVIR